MPAALTAIRLGLISSGPDDFCRAMRSATTPPAPSTATMITRTNRFFRARMGPSRDRGSGRRGRESSAESGGQLDGGADAVDQADAAERVADHRQSRPARDGAVDGAHAGAMLEIVLRDAGPRAPDVDEVGIAPQAGGALQVRHGPRGQRAVVGIHRGGIEGA